MEFWSHWSSFGLFWNIRVWLLRHLLCLTWVQKEKLSNARRAQRADGREFKRRANMYGTSRAKPTKRCWWFECIPDTLMINTPSPPCFPHSELAFHNLSIYSTHESKDLTTSSEWCLEMGALPLCKGDKGHLFPIKIFTDFFNLPGSTSSGVRGRGTSSSGILFATANNHKKDIVLFWVLLWWRLAVGNCGLCDLLPLCH